MARWGAVDVHYPATGGATAALVVAADALFSRIIGEHVVQCAQVEAYRPGAFYERELPPLKAVVETTEPLELLIIDGYVTLDPTGRPGLGHHVHQTLRVPVIGVAKTAFRSATHAVEVYRGSSRRPLLITAEGLPAADAAGLIRSMVGAHRLPDALKRVDALSRSSAAQR